jgi:hypothetical protein
MDLQPELTPIMYTVHIDGSAPGDYAEIPTDEANRLIAGGLAVAAQAIDSPHPH